MHMVLLLLYNHYRNSSELNSYNFIFLFKFVQMWNSANIILCSIFHCLYFIFYLIYIILCLRLINQIN